MDEERLIDALDEIFGLKKDSDSLVGEIKNLNETIKELKEEVNKLKHSLDDVRRSL